MKRHDVPFHMIQTMAAANYGMNHTQHAYGLVLYALVHWLKPEIIVEIGSRRGFSSMWMAKALEELSTGFEDGNGGLLYCIDPFISAFGGGPDQAQEFTQNITHLGLEDRVRLIPKTSSDAKEEIPKIIDMLYLDGDLSEEGIATDLVNYEGRIARGGCLAIHDLKSEPAVAPAIKKFSHIFNAYIPMILDDQLGMWFGVKTA